MRDVLEDIRHLLVPQLRPQQVIVHLSQLLIREMVPRACVTIEQRRRLDELPTAFTPLALVRIVRVAQRLAIELEQLPKIVLREMSGGIFCFVHNTGRKILFLTSDVSLYPRCVWRELTAAEKSFPRSYLSFGIDTQSLDIEHKALPR